MSELVYETKFEVTNLLLSSKEIKSLVEQIAQELNADINTGLIKQPVFICVLEGAMLFFTDLIRRIPSEIETGTVDVSSYEGNIRTDDIRIDFNMGDTFNNKDFIIVEDIIDSGKSMEELIKACHYYYAPTSITVVSLLARNEQSVEKIRPSHNIYIGQYLNNDDFIWGYGLDLDGKMRNLNAIYSTEVK